MSSNDRTHASNRSDAVEISDRTNALVRGLQFVMHHHRATAVMCRLMKEQVSTYLSSTKDEMVWLKRAKYLLCYPLAKYLRNELPPSPDSVPRFSGAFRRWMKARFNAYNRSNTHLWYSWLQCKRSALPVSDDLVEDAYKKHFETLTKHDPLEGYEGGLTLERFMRHPVFSKVLQKTANQIACIFRDDFSERVASTSACFEASRSKGGQYASLRDICTTPSSREEILGEVEGRHTLLFEDEPLTKLPFEYPDTPEILREITGLPEASLGKAWDFSESSECPNRICFHKEDKVFTPFLGGDELVSMQWIKVVDGGRLRQGVVQLYENCGRLWWETLAFWAQRDSWERDGKCDAVIQVVLEPLKMRIISKGNSLSYYRVKPFQKAMHTALRRWNCFRLIGRRISPTDLVDLMPQSESSWRSLQNKWASVDYSAATDGLSSLLGHSILERLYSGIHATIRSDGTWDTRHAFKAGFSPADLHRVLGSHKLWYPKRVSRMRNGQLEKEWSTPELRGEQTNGQLMGSPLSFPILCLANLAVYCQVKDPQSIEELDSVLINGDDMLYVGDDIDWENHKRLSGSVGLEMSVGKSYLHHRYANVNSCSFDCKLTPGSTPWQIDYLNAGLVFGQHKVQVKESRERQAAADHHQSSDLVSNIDEILKGSLPGRQCDLLRSVLEARYKEARKDSFSMILEKGRKPRSYHRNMFLPTVFGGLGVDAPVGWKFRITSEDRKVAMGRLLSGLSFSVLPSLPGFELESLSSVPPWIAKQAEPDIPYFRVTERKMKNIPLGHHVVLAPHRGVRTG
jgi:hypothetical protein